MIARDRGSSRARRGPDPAGRAGVLLVGAGGLPGGRRRDVHRRGRPAGGLYNPRPPHPRRPREPEGDRARRPPARRGACSAARAAPRVGLGSRHPPLRPGRAARLGGMEIAGAPRLPGTPTGTSRFTPSPTRSWARRPSATWAACSPRTAGRRAGSPARSCSRTSSAASPAAAGARRRGPDDRGARPRLAASLEPCGRRSPGSSASTAGGVGVKASTGNLDGAEGAGAAASAATRDVAERSGRPA